MNELEKAVYLWFGKHERSLAYLSRQVGASRQSVYMWLSGTVRPSKPKGMKLHLITGIPVELIFGNKKETK